MDKKKILIISRDITERKKSYEYIEKENLRLQQLDQLRKVILARATHEIKNPLIALTLAINVLKNNFTSNNLSGSEELINNISEQIHQTKNLALNLLEFTMLEINKFQIKKTLIDLNKLILKCINAEKFRANARNITFSFKPEENIYIEGDELNITQVFTNCMSYPTFHRRIQTLNGLDVAKKRMGNRNAEKQFELTEAEFPHADFPLQSVQIDHTPIDVMVVDEENRLVTIRPYLTLAIDCYTRCILGYHLTYEKPSRLSIAMALIDCIQDKQKDLEKIKNQFPELDTNTFEMIQTSEWRDVYGLPYTLHMDNGPDFRSNDIHLFGIRYKVHLHYRAVKKPQHGAYVERYLGTLNSNLHSLEGTTFSNTLERKDYPSEKRATYTMKELEARILLEFLKYHNQFHSEIRMAPIKRWQNAFNRTTLETAITRNLSQIDPSIYYLDVLPSDTRTVQKSGVQMFGLSYTDPRIQQWIGAKNQESPSTHQNFLIRYDLRDIRTIYFYSPIDKGYIPLKCNDRFVQTYFPNQDLTLWQWDTIKRNQKIEYNHPSLDYAGKKYAYIQAQQAIEKEVATRTKSARIKRARQQANTAQRQEFMELTGLASQKDSVECHDLAYYKHRYNTDLEIISIPPNDQNPFYGIEVDMQTGEIKKKGK